MPKNSTKTGKKPKAQRRPVARPGKKKSIHTAKRTPIHSCVYDEAGAAYVLVPAGEYEKLIKASMIENAITKLDNDGTEWVDADGLGLQIAAERIANARKAAGLTQKQLGDKLKLPQSQISRIERKPDHTTVKTLKRIARALGVDVRSLV